MGEWMYSSTVLLLYPRGKSLRYLLVRRLSGPQGLSGCYGADKILLSLPGIVPSRPAP
jgi:hypothetical protein